jgi:hypothetical protein
MNCGVLGGYYFRKKARTSLMNALELRGLLSTLTLKEQ